MDEMFESIKEEVLKTKPRDIFGVIISEKSFSIVGLGTVSLSEKAHIILSLRNFADHMEKDLFKDYNDEIHP